MGSRGAQGEPRDRWERAAPQGFSRLSWVQVVTLQHHGTFLQELHPPHPHGKQQKCRAWGKTQFAAKKSAAVNICSVTSGKISCSDLFFYPHPHL